MKIEQHSKILICGISGAGKTTLARNLSQKYGYKALYLDQYFWLENWTKRPSDDFFNILDKETEGEKWILEGALLKVVRRYIGKSDLVIWMRPNKLVAIYRIFKRVLTHYGEVREELAPGCYEKLDFEFLKWIWNYPKNKDAELEKILLESGVKFIIM